MHPPQYKPRRSHSTYLQLLCGPTPANNCNEQQQQRNKHAATHSMGQRPQTFATSSSSSSETNTQLHTVHKKNCSRQCFFVKHAVLRRAPTYTKTAPYQSLPPSLFHHPLVGFHCTSLHFTPLPPPLPEKKRELRRIRLWYRVRVLYYMTAIIGCRAQEAAKQCN